MILYVLLFVVSVWALSELAWLACPEDRRGPWPDSFEWELWLRHGSDRPDAKKNLNLFLLAGAAVGVFVLLRMFKKGCLK